MASLNQAPAFAFLHNAGTDHSGNVFYAAAYATPNGASDVIQFQSYTVAGAPDSAGPSFQVTPNLSAYAAGATDLIDQQPPSNGALLPGIAVTGNQGANSGFSFAWNDSVTDSNGSHDQVEFAIVRNGSVVSQSTFQIADGDAQSVRLLSTNISGVNVELLAYGDDSGTHVVEFDSNGNEIASLFDPSTQTNTSMELFGDGRIGLVYDNTLDPSGTTQYVTDIYDLRTTGLINDHLGSGRDNDVAGTQFSDAVFGGNNVNNAYYYVGQNTTTGAGPTDSFTGGSGSGWNVAILPDARSYYEISTNGAVTTAVNDGNNDNSYDPAHAGTLITTNVQALAFEPSQDPGPDSSGGVEVTGGETLVLLNDPVGTTTYPVTIDAGGTLEIMASGSVTPVTFAPGAGTLQLDFDQQASYAGTISGFGSGGTIDLTYLHYTPAETAVWDAATNTLTVNGSETVALSLAGSYAQDSFALTSDALGATEVVSSPTTVTVAGLDGNGDAVAGQAVTVSLGNTNLGPISYTWLADGQAIAGATNASFTPTSADEGKTLDVVASFVDPATGAVEAVTGVAGTLAAVAPTLTIADSTLSVAEGGAVALGIGETPFNAHDPISITITGLPADATLTDNNNDTLTIDNGSITLTPTELSGLTFDAGDTSAELTVTATNTAGATASSSSQTIDVTVAGPLVLTGAGLSGEIVNNFGGGSVNDGVGLTPTASFTASDINYGPNTNSLTLFLDNNGQTDGNTITNSAGGDGVQSVYLQMNGYMLLTGGQQYTFHLNSDDGSVLSIGGAQIVNDDGFHGGQDAFGTFTPGATGYYPIEVQYFQGGGGAQLLAQYSTDGGNTYTDLTSAVLSQAPLQADLGATATMNFTDGDAGSTVTITGLPDDLSGFNGGSYTAGNNPNTGTWTGTAAAFNALSFTTGAAGTYALTITAADGNATTTAGDTLAVMPDPVANTITIGNASGPSSSGWTYDAENGHYYKLVSTSTDWNSAQTAAAADDGAYLATVTTAGEQSLITDLLVGNGAFNAAWGGGDSTNDASSSQAVNAATFYWVTGPEAGTLINDFGYANWNNNGLPPGSVGPEPNSGFGSTEAEQFENSGLWNDAPANSNAVDYVEEWGGLPGQVAFAENTPTDLTAAQLLASDTGNNPSLVSVGATSAHGGTVTLDHGIVTYTPGVDYSGDDSFTYTITDGTLQSTGTVTFNVAAGPTLEWNSSTSDDWNTAADWTANAAATDSIPTGGDDAKITASGGSPYTVTIGSGDTVTAQMLTMVSDQATIALQGSLALTGGLEVNNGAFDLEGGTLQALSIDVKGGATFSGYGTITGPVAVSGTIEATASGPALEFTGFVTGNAAFTIDAGATLQFDGATSPARSSPSPPAQARSSLSKPILSRARLPVLRQAATCWISVGCPPAPETHCSWFLRAAASSPTLRS